MKCDRCGYYNKSENDICSVCGNPLSESPVLKYKQNAKKSNGNDKTFNTTQKVVIAICTLAVLMLIASAVIPSDFDYTGLLGNNNNTQENTPVELNDTTVRIDTQIQVNSAGFGTKDQVIVNAYVKDINNYPVNGGTASITLNGVKFSGNVENGNVNIQIPKLNGERPEVTVVYEGNDEYNPSEVTTTLEITKISTQIDVEYNNSTITATLKTANNEKIPDSTIKVLYSNNTSTDKQTDSDGRITLDTNFDSSISSIKLSYAGNQQYNPCEKNIEIENSKTDTKIYADFDEKERSISLKLVDVNNHPIGDAALDIDCNNTKNSQKTNSSGLVEIPVNVGVCKFTIKYAGNDTFNPSETTINTVIEENDTANDTHNNTTNDTKNTTNTTANNTNNTTSNNTTNSSSNTSINNTANTTQNSTNKSDNTTQNKTNDTDSSVNDTDNKTQDNSKVNTTIKSKIIKENKTLVINLLTEDNKAISHEYVKIILDNGTEITRQTDGDGNIMLDLDDYGSIEHMEFRFVGDKDYAPSEDYIVI